MERKLSYGDLTPEQKVAIEEIYNRAEELLLGANINILDITPSICDSGEGGSYTNDRVVRFEFQWRQSANDKPRWSKYAIFVEDTLDMQGISGMVYMKVQQLRAKLEK